MQSDGPVRRRRPGHRQRRPEQPHPRPATPRPSAPTSTCATAASSGSAPASCSRRSRSPSRRPSGAGSRRTPTASTTTTSTFIVETPERVWRAAGLDTMEKEDAIAFCEKLFAKYLDGHSLMSNAGHLRGSAQWIRFPRVVCESWVHDNGRAPVVLMGDAAHTAHFSIGSGTKLALEDAIELARCDRRSTPATCAPRSRHYEDVRSIEVLRIQNAARNSTEWFEHVDRYVNLPPRAVRLLAAHAQPAHQPREPAPARQGLRRELRGLDRRERRRAPRARCARRSRRCSRPFTARGVTLKNRIVVSPMAQYSCVDGMPGDYPPRAPRRARDGRRRHGRRRDDLPVARRAHHPGLPGPVERGAARRLEADRRLRPRQHRRQDRDAARPRRRQGLDPRALGRRGPAARATATGRSSRPRRSSTSTA